MANKFICCLCGKECEGYGNNPYPIKQEGRCCDECNKKVIEHRIRMREANKIINSF